MGPIGSARYYCYEKEDDTWSASSRRINGFVPNNFFFSFFSDCRAQMRSSEINDLENVYLRCDNLKKKSRNKHDPWNDDYAIENLFFFFYLYFSFPRFY